MNRNGDMPDVSIVVCTRNRAPQLTEALRFYRDVEHAGGWELIVVDNASSDETRDVVEKARAEIPQLRYLREERIGLGAARDRAWREAKAPIVVFTDDDCYPASDFVTRYVDCFNERPDVDFIAGKIYLWDPEDLPITIDLRETAEDIRPCMYLPPGAVQGANMAFRVAALERIGGFDTALGAGTPYPCEDIDAAAAAVWAGMSGRYDPRPVVHHHHRRRHEHFRDVFSGYDRGRGAYYMKYLLNPKSRTAYARAWAGSIWRIRSLWDMKAFFREAGSALRYLGDRRTRSARSSVEARVNAIERV
jgi:glycosyltransferase involved in cell wall biosynthesis